MGARIRMQIDPADKILLKRSLNKNGEGQRFFTHEVRRLSDPYVPKRSGKLKNTAVETKQALPTTLLMRGDSITNIKVMGCVDHTGQSGCGQTEARKLSGR